MKKAIIAAALVVAMVLAVGVSLLLRQRPERPEQPPLTAADIELLRERYPKVTDPQIGDGPSWSSLVGQNEWLRRIHYLFRAEVSGEWETYSFSASPTDNPGDGLSVQIDYYLLPVKITEWIDVEDGVEKLPENIWICYTLAYFTSSDMKYFPEGSSFVFAGNQFEAFPEYKDVPVLFMNPSLTFYVTDSEYIVNYGRQDLTDFYAGSTYDAFRKEMLQVTSGSGWHEN